MALVRDRAAEANSAAQAALDHHSAELALQKVKEGPFRASNKGETLTSGPLRDPQNSPKWSSDSHTFRSVSRRLFGVGRGACTFIQPFNAIFGCGIISERIPVD